MKNKYPEQSKILAEYGIDISEIDENCVIPAKTLLQHLKALEAFGFSKNAILKMVKRFPSILSYTAERTNPLLQNLIDLGLDKKIVLEIVKKMPAILGYTAELAISSVQDLLEHEDEDNLKKVLKPSPPPILSDTTKRTIALVEIFSELNFDIRELHNTFMFSPKPLWGRLIFLRAKDITPEKKNMFLSNKQFEARFGISRAELIELAKK